MTVTLNEIMNHEKINKYMERAGFNHCVNTAYFAYNLCLESENEIDIMNTVKAALLHDIGHYFWYKENGEWDLESYKRNDIHAIKGAERAHRLLISLGEDEKIAKEISVAVLLHTDSYLPENVIKRTKMQEIVKLADELDEKSDGNHHRVKISWDEAKEKISNLQEKILKRTI